MTPMDVHNVVKTVLGCINFLINLTKDFRETSGELTGSLSRIKFELELIQRDIEKDEDLKLQELAYDIEDFIHGLWTPGLCGSFILSATGMDPRPQDITRIKFLLESIESLRKRSRESSDQPRQSGGSTSATPGLSSSAGSPPCYAPEKDLVGITGPKREIVELLSPGDGQLKVISIVGSSGVGKTALARALYDDRAVAREFHCKAWIVASKCSHALELVDQILQQVHPRAGTADNPRDRCESTFQSLESFLLSKRYLVFIDDVQPQGLQWKDIRDAFPENGRGSKIIVTTCVHSLAAACSPGRYMYRMQCLDQDKSKDLFWRKVCGCPTAPAPALAVGSEIILDKCDGLPLALISAANYLGGIGAEGSLLTKADCEDVGKQLGKFLASNERDFGELRRALIQCYDSLPEYVHKNCLLYVCIFPRGYRINIKRLARRLIAEGLVAGDVRQYLEKLIGENVIEPTPIRYNSKVVKRCQVHSIMLEFTIHKSVSRNLVTLIHKDQPLHKEYCSVRRLSVQSSTKVGCDGLADDLGGLSALRSLTTFSSELLDFKSCKLLRVLDLEGCVGLDRGVVDDICELVFLKYLSLRNTNVDKLPTKVKKLKCLETLDIRETRVAILPVEVIMLPQLAYLFGRFELPLLAGSRETEELTKFLKEKSKLHTLAGIVIDETQVLEIVIPHAKNLKKIKLWCKDTPATAGAPAPSPASVPSSSAPATSTSLAPSSTSARATFPVRCSSSTVLPPRPRSTPARNRKFWFSACFGLSGESAVDPASNAIPESIPKLVVATGRASAPSPTCTPAPPPQNSNLVATLADTLVSSLEKRSIGLESLFVDFNGVQNDFLGSLKPPYTISSLKIRRGLGSLPDSDNLREVRNLNKLQLFLTGLSSKQLVALQNLKCLEYLKLYECRDGLWDDDFSVQRGGFPSLQELCFEGPKHPRVRIDEQGALSRLTSLQLLCPESPHTAEEIESPLGVDRISLLDNLHEVILHHSADEAKVEAWKREAKRHKNRPCVKKQPAESVSPVA